MAVGGRAVESLVDARIARAAVSLEVTHGSRDNSSDRSLTMNPYF